MGVGHGVGDLSSETLQTPPAWEVGRTSFLGFPAASLLDQSCAFVSDALGERCYLVGSALESRDFRDVDVRVIMDDAKFDSLFGAEKGLNAWWNLFCVAVSVYLADRSGLDIDFQVQKRSRVPDDDWGKPRVPLGVYADHPTRRPPWNRGDET